MKKCYTFVVHDQIFNNVTTNRENPKKQAGRVGESPSVSPLWHCHEGLSCSDPALFSLPKKLCIMHDTRANLDPDLVETLKQVEALTPEQHDLIMSFCLSRSSRPVTEFVMSYGLFFSFREFLINYREEVLI
jgi:hypothetical protein